ncbi:MAG: hypothetical protein EAZ09_16315 [Oscillatoriales cyanobacterium]|nr:MAG: hypothetical protein EAZ18_13210 [Oscillatoriales cyanobacterium]TAH19446.1 MAG: hypothetical protein EAZ09_16315 [Oscillatoriales cyanobacterium]
MVGVVFLIPNYQLPIPNYQFPITNYQFPITNYQFPIPNSQLPITINKSIYWLIFMAVNLR